MPPKIVNNPGPIASDVIKSALKDAGIKPSSITKGK